MKKKRIFAVFCLIPLLLSISACAGRESGSEQMISGLESDGNGENEAAEPVNNLLFTEQSFLSVESIRICRTDPIDGREAESYASPDNLVQWLNDTLVETEIIRIGGREEIANVARMFNGWEMPAGDSVDNIPEYVIHFGDGITVFFSAAFPDEKEYIGYFDGQYRLLPIDFGEWLMRTVEEAEP